MERSDTRDEVEQLRMTMLGYLPVDLPSPFWDAYGKLVAYAKQAGWPSELHKQYMAVLDERDILQEQYDSLQEQYSDLRWRMDGLEK